MADDKIVGKRWVAAEYGTPESLKLEEFNVPAPRGGVSDPAGPLKHDRLIAPVSA